MKRKINGYITVYLALILGSMIMLITTIIEGARRQTVRFETECVMDAALTSVFAEYHREMLNRYGLLYIDDSYGKTGNPNNTKNHFLRYMNKNFGREEFSKGDVELLGLHADNAELMNVSFASDSQGTVHRYQIVQYMKSKSGLSLVSSDEYNPFDIADNADEFESYKAKREALDNQIDGFVEQYNATKENGEDLYDVSNPADSVEKSPDGGILFYAFGNTEALSTKCINTKDYISNRGYAEGHGLYENQKAPYSVADKVLFNTYLFERLGYKGNEKENCGLDYQIEYLLEGKDGDIENLEAVIRRIFYIRYGVNISYLKSDAEKQNEAYALALTATSVIAQPELAQAVKEAILLAWAYAESAKDLRILFDGNKLAMIKTTQDWNTTLEELPNFKSYLSNYHIPVSGVIDYDGFLKSFISLENAKRLNMRLLDITEMDIRLTSGNARFCADNLIYQCYISSNISSRFGYGYSIKRGFSYR